MLECLHALLYLQHEQMQLHGRSLRQNQGQGRSVVKVRRKLCHVFMTSLLPAPLSMGKT